MTRRCCHCNSDGHNFRKCPTKGAAAASPGGPGGVKLFGVRLTDGSIMKKSASMGNLSSHYQSSPSATASPDPGSPSSDQFRDPLRLADGYASDDPLHVSSCSNHRTERKKGNPWTKDEHRLFLLGLQKLGKGDWRGISRNFVTSRTPTQVASHAQKHFVRQTNSTRRRRRSSLFDMVPEVAGDTLVMPNEQPGLPPQVANNSNEELANLHSQEEDNKEGSLPFVDLSIKQDSEPMEVLPSRPVQETKDFLLPPMIPYLIPPFYPAFVPLPVQFQLWPSSVAAPQEDKKTDASQHQVLKPIPLFPKEPVNVDELVGLSELNLGDSRSGLRDSSTQLSLELIGQPSRQSAFHAKTPDRGKEQREEHN